MFSGYSVEVCADGDDVVSRGIENDYDAIVLDVMLPGRDGFSVCPELRPRPLGADPDAQGARRGRGPDPRLGRGRR